MNNRAMQLTGEIEILENRQRTEYNELKSQFDFTIATLSPTNFLKSTLQDAIATPELQNSIVDSAIGMATGYISKKVLIGSTHNPIKKLFGSIFQLIVTNYVSKHSDSIKYASEMVLDKVFHKKN
jgi:hypothetical protein